MMRIGKKLLFLCCVMMLSMAAVAQEADNVDVQTRAEFPGGQKALTKFFEKNIMYPDDAAAYQVEGSVIMTFMVNEDGSLSEITAVDCKLDRFNTTKFTQETEERQKELRYQFAKSFAKEGFRLVRKMPKWTPAKVNGKPVRSRFSQRIHFYVVGK